MFSLDFFFFTHQSCQYPQTTPAGICLKQPFINLTEIASARSQMSRWRGKSGLMRGVHALPALRERAGPRFHNSKLPPEENWANLCLVK